MGKLNKTDREWQRELSPDEFRITRQKGTEPAFTGNIGILNKPALMYVAAVVRHYLILKINMTVVAAGQVFISHSIRL
jgi:peptide methionine sulfoxide reductase MsrB